MEYKHFTAIIIMLDAPPVKKIKLVKNELLIKTYGHSHDLGKCETLFEILNKTIPQIITGA